MIQIETIFDILVKGFIIGVVVSAPLGPVGVLCIQRTLNKGRWYGFVTGLGASLSDIAYALLTGYGMSFVFDYINKNIFYLQLLGSIMLLLFGTIACAGIANLVNNCIDLSRTRNIVIVSLTLTVGIGGAAFSWGDFSLSGIGLAALVGVVLNLILPKED